ncbi:hypothetical protein [Stenotrophomonas hibiscicola]|uniref:hypothetical protein n=1 Tax=Stenotrophomonas hibiscicola TaxID=86189 RepID=UPI003D0EABE6
MTTPPNPLETVRWEHHDAAVYHGLYLPSFATFQREVVFTAVGALDHRIEAFHNSEEEVERVFAAQHYCELRQSTIEAFLLATQSMHERALRDLMAGMAGRMAWSKGKLEQIQRCSLGGKSPNLQSLFRDLFGAPMEWFGIHEDLLFLHLLGNALRHGDGDAAIKIHQCAPSLWITWLPPGSAIGGLYTAPPNAPRHPAFDAITLPRVVLEQMMMAVTAFWEDIEFVRCNSFSTKSEGVVKLMDSLRSKRDLRSNERVWSPG